MRRALAFRRAGPQAARPEAFRVQRASEEVRNLLGGRVGRAAPVLWVAAADRVAHAAADDVRGVTRRDELLDHALDVPGDLQIGDVHRLSLADVRASGYRRVAAPR